MAEAVWTKSSLAATTTTLLTLLAAVHWRVASGHGRLIDPPSRASMWRYGYDTPHNTDDMALWCGGFSTQWEINGGRCGVCGDPYNGPRDHEAGGKYANGIIVRHYRSGETISVSVELTTSHMGYFEFRLCPNNDAGRRVTQQCLDRFLLRQPDGSTRFPVTSPAQGIRNVQLVLPSGLECTQCVLQWKYNTANSLGCEEVGPQQRCCMGCGRQEQYYACADVDIASGGSGGGTVTQQTSGPQPAVSQSSPRPQTPPGLAPTLPAGFLPLQPPVMGSYSTTCYGINEYFTDYCRTVCRSGPLLCPPLYCSAECQYLQSA